MRDTSVEGFTLEVAFDAPIERVFETLTTFDRFEDYTDAARIAVRGEGVGTRCYINLQKRVLDIPARYTVRAKLTEMEEPTKVGWEVTQDLDIWGGYELSENEGETTIQLSFNIDLGDSDLDALPAPPGASPEEIVQMVLPALGSESSGILRGLTEDIEGEPRKPKVTVRESSTLFEDALQEFF